MRSLRELRAACARIATEARVRQRIERGRKLDQLINDGVPVKRAAFDVGWSARSASRWRQQKRAHDAIQRLFYVEPIHTLPKHGADIPPPSRSSRAVTEGGQVQPSTRLSANPFPTGAENV